MRCHGAQGLRGVPHEALWPSGEMARLTIFVLPNITAPVWRIAFTRGASSVTKRRDAICRHPTCRP